MRWEGGRAERMSSNDVALPQESATAVWAGTHLPGECTRRYGGEGRNGSCLCVLSLSLFLSLSLSRARALSLLSPLVYLSTIQAVMLSYTAEELLQYQCLADVCSGKGAAVRVLLSQPCWARSFIQPPPVPPTAYIRNADTRVRLDASRRCDVY